MKKLVALIGGIIILVGVFIGLIDPSLGWWQMDITYTIFNNTKEGALYLSSFGGITDTYNDSTDQLEGAIIYIIMALAALGGILLIVGAAKESSGIAFIGVLMAIGGLAYFIYALPNFEQLVDFATIGSNTPENMVWGSADLTFIGEYTLNWRLGNGYIITAAGALVSLIGVVMKEK
jgi:hypothetical protein